MNFKIFILIICLYLPVFSWGYAGHKAIARIAEDNLSSETISKIKPLLSGNSLEDVSVWADNYKRSHRNTGSWHYINLPVRKNVSVNDIQQIYTYSNENNIDTQLKKNIAFLKSGRGSFKERQTALWFVIHLVGDLHMPLHIGDDNDKGGNDKLVRYFNPSFRSNKGHVTNLHSLWDNLIEVKAAEDPQELGDELNRKVNTSQKQKWCAGSIDEWVYESYLTSKKQIFSYFPSYTQSVIPLPKNYYSMMRPICDKQLQKAGIRLAYILEDIFKKSAST